MSAGGSGETKCVPGVPYHDTIWCVHLKPDKPATEALYFQLINISITVVTSDVFWKEEKAKTANEISSKNDEDISKCEASTWHNK